MAATSAWRTARSAPARSLRRRRAASSERSLPAGRAVAAGEREPQARERQRLQREPGAAGTQRREPELPQRRVERKRAHERDDALLTAKAVPARGTPNRGAGMPPQRRSADRRRNRRSRIPDLARRASSARRSRSRWPRVSATPWSTAERARGDDDLRQRVVGPGLRRIHRQHDHRNALAVGRAFGAAAAASGLSRHHFAAELEAVRRASCCGTSGRSRPAGPIGPRRAARSSSPMRSGQGAGRSAAARSRPACD